MLIYLYNICFIIFPLSNMISKTIASWIAPLPSIPHRTLTLSEIKSKTIIIGDIHGCLNEFKELLNKCNYNTVDSTLILIGDLVNKGPFSAEVIKYARSLPNTYCIRGNHDDSVLSYAVQSDSSKRPAHYSYIDKLDSDDINWLQNLPYTIYLPPYNTLCVHAGLVPNVSLDKQSQIDMVTMRNVVKNTPNIEVNEDVSITASSNIIDNNNIGTSSWIGTARDDIGIPWASVWGVENNDCSLLFASNDFDNMSVTEIPHVYFGHDAKRQLQLYDYATGLDTGCCYGKKLTAIVLPEKEFFDVNAHMMYSEPKSKE